MRWMSHAVAWGAVLVGLGAHMGAAAQEAGDALRMSDGASLSTQADAAFHDIGTEGLTIEGWFYLDELPEVGEVQTFFSNPSKYALGMGIAKGDGDDEWYDPNEVRAFGSLSSEQGWGSRIKGTMGEGDHRNPPIKKWFHVAWQFHAEPPEVGWFYVHKQPIPLGRDERFPWALPAGDGALSIATAKLGQHGFGVEPDTDISVFRGLVDEVRVSSIARYDGRDAVRPRHFRPDRHTVALWTFDGDRPYADSSGAGHHLTHTGTITVEPLAVDGRGRLATTWAQIRSGGR